MFSPIIASLHEKLCLTTIELIEISRKVSSKHGLLRIEPGLSRDNLMNRSCNIYFVLHDHFFVLNAKRIKGRQ